MQLSLIGALTIGVPAFFLALEPNKSRIEGHFLSNIFYKALPGGLTNLALILGVELFAFAFDLPISQLYNISSVIILFVGLLVLFQVCKPFDWKRWTIWGSMAAASLLCIMPAGSLFGTQPLTLQSFLIMIVFLLLAQPCIHAAFWLFQEGRTLLSKMQENEWEQN